MLFAWFKRRRRRKLLAGPFPAEWQAVLEGVAYYHFLPADQQARLRDAVRIFVAEKEFEGCNGLMVWDFMRVTIAGLASILVLGLDDYYHDNVQTILVYPTGFVAPEATPIGTEAVLEDESDRLGEAHYRGPVILSWDEVEQDARDPGQGFNLVFHEFAHQIDMLNGAADGVPVLPSELQKRWQRVMAEEYEKLCKAADRGRETLIDPYGASEPAEFFAVVTETFFDLPRELKREHPELYGLFREFYRQDPAGWKM